MPEVSQFHIEEPVMMCHTEEANFWAHGWQDKTKFKGRVLSEADLYDLGYEPKDIFTGKVVQGWVISVAGDTSGCGWDTTMYFQKEEPKVDEDEHGNRSWDGATVYDQMCRVHKLLWEDHDWDVQKEGDCSDEERDAQVVDGPHKATWWEPPPEGKRSW